jgi:hypothetical protein
VFQFGKNGSNPANYKFNSDVGTVTFDNTTDVELKNAGGLKLFNGSNSIAVKSPSLSGSYTFTLPNSSGTDGHVLKTDGSGTTSWVDVTAVSDAILDSDFSGSSGLMKKTGAGTYAIATANTDYQLPPSEGAFANGDKTKLDYITVGSAINLGQAILTTTSDVSSASFVDTDVTFGSPTNSLVPRSKISSTQNSASGNGALSYSQSTGVISYTPPDLSSYLTSAPPVTLTNTNYLSLNGQELTGGTVPIGSGGTGATSVAAAKVNLSLEDSDIRSKFSAGTGISYDSSTGEISSTVTNTNTQNTTTLSFQDSGDDIVLRNTTGGAGSGNQDININAGSNITLTHTDSNNITIASTASGGASALNDLSDVTVGGASSGQYLVHNGGAFVNQALDISQDNDPDLGGDLDVGDHSIITSTGNKDITLNPDGTGKVNLGTYPIKADDTAPDSGDNLKVLTYVDGDSEIRLVSNPQGTVTTPSSPAPSSTQIAAFTATADQITGFDTFTIDGSGFTTPNVLVKQGTLSAPGRYGSGSRVTRTMFTSANSDKTAGDVYVMNSSASVWTAKADADAESTASGLLAVAGSTQSASGMVLSGIVRVADNSGFSNADPGDILYLHTDAGHVSDSKPTGSGKVVRIVGYVVHAGTQAGNDGVIYFDPSKDYITLS